MKFSDIHIRDPFILLEDGTYYMYGSRGWKPGEGFGHSTGFDVYKSTDLENWSAPKSVFEMNPSFWGTENFWAPEVHKYNGKFYMFASFKAEGICRATQILVCDTPDGQFKIHSEKPITPADWECLDGTFYVDKKGTPYMIFCHEWVQIRDGEMCVTELSKDLTHPVGEPKTLFKASCVQDAPNDTDTYVTDGPFLFRTRNDELIMLWSSMKNNKYIEAISYSDNGEIDGNWKPYPTPLFQDDGGHGMIFCDKEKKLHFIMHYPNKNPYERPRLFTLAESENGYLSIKED